MPPPVIFRSPHQALEIPSAAVADFVLRRASERGTRSALVDTVSQRTITYRDLTEDVARVAAGLAGLGLKKGQVCAIFSPNTIDYAIAVLAIVRLGAIVTTANHQYTVDELAPQLQDARAKILIAAPSVQAVALEAARLGGAEHVVAFGEFAGATPFDELRQSTISPPDVTINPDAIVVMPYSSGTTGLPK